MVICYRKGLVLLFDHVKVLVPLPCIRKELRGPRMRWPIDMVICYPKGLLILFPHVSMVICYRKGLVLLFPHKLQVFTIFILIRAIWWPLRGKIHAIRCYISIKTVCNLSYFIFPLSLPLSLSSLKILKKGCIIWQIVINYAHDFFKFLFKTIKLKMSLWCSMIYF